MSRGPVVFAVVGLGVGEQHARRLAADGRCRVKWLADLYRAKAGRLAAGLAAAAAGSLDEVLADPEVEAVVLATYDGDHFAQVMASLSAGKHVFVEKPLCRTIQELKAVKQAWQAQRGRLKLASNLILRAAPLYQWLRGELVTGRLGRLYAVDGEYLYGRLHKITKGWRKDVADYSVMDGGGIHLVDLILWLTGQRPAEVLAAGNRISTEGSGFHHLDYLTATLKFSSGLIGRVTANFGCVHRHQHVLRLFGTEATFLYDDAGARLHTTRDPEDPNEAAAPPRRIDADPLPGHKGDLLPGFVTAIAENEDLAAETQTLFDVVSVCAAVNRSVESNTWVRVEYV